MEAGNDMKIKVGHDRTLEVGNDDETTVDHNQTLSVSNDQGISIGNNQTLSVSEDQNVRVDGSSEVNVGETASLDAKEIYEDASQKMGLYSQTHEQKADSTMKINAGTQIDIKANITKINS